ncbi:MAG TPA: M48 family metalloprotease [Verrucomicrobiae bacterium]|nr:M48 family metalloprotease [Verrucomicrobiae bacterium]
MSEDALNYDATAFNPSLGNESVTGRIVPTQFTLRFESETTEIIFPANETTLCVGEGDDERLFFHHSKQPDWTIATADYEILNHRLFAKNTHLRKQVEAIFGRKASRKAIIITLSALLCFAFIGLSASWMMDKIVRHAVAQISPATEKSFGDKQCEQIKAIVEVTQDPKLIGKLDAIYAQLRVGLPDTNMTVEFHIIEDPMPNAGSIPGHIFVNRGLFDLLNTSDQLAGVMAHELGHITQKHVFRRIVSRQAPAYLLKTVFHNSRGTMAAVARTSQFVLGQSFSREYEREADSEGWKYLVAANINPHGFIEALQRLQEFEGKNLRGSTILSDHPPTEDRVQQLESRWKSLRQKSGFIEFPDAEH